MASPPHRGENEHRSRPEHKPPGLALDRDRSEDRPQQARRADGKERSNRRSSRLGDDKGRKESDPTGMPLDVSEPLVEEVRTRGRRRRRDGIRSNRVCSQVDTVTVNVEDRRDDGHHERHSEPTQSCEHKRRGAEDDKGRQEVDEVARSRTQARFDLVMG